MALFLKPIRLSLKAKLALMIEGWVVVLVVQGVSHMREKRIGNEFEKGSLCLRLAGYVRACSAMTFPRPRLCQSHGEEYCSLRHRFGKTVKWCCQCLSEVGTSFRTLERCSDRRTGETGVHESREELHCDMSVIRFGVSWERFGGFICDRKGNSYAKANSHDRFLTPCGGVVAILAGYTFPIVEIPLPREGWTAARCALMMQARRNRRLTGFTR